MYVYFMPCYVSHLFILLLLWLKKQLYVCEHTLWLFVCILLSISTYANFIYYRLFLLWWVFPILTFVVSCICIYLRNFIYGGEGYCYISSVYGSNFHYHSFFTFNKAIEVCEELFSLFFSIQKVFTTRTYFVIFMFGSWLAEIIVCRFFWSTSPLVIVEVT